MRLTWKVLNKLSRFARYVEQEGWEDPDLAKRVTVTVNGRIYKKEAYKRLKGKDSMPVVADCLTIKGKRAYSQMRKILEVLEAKILTKPRIARGGILFHTMFDPGVKMDFVLVGENASIIPTS